MVTVIPRLAWTTAANGRKGRPIDPATAIGVTYHWPTGNDLLNLSMTQVFAKLRTWRAQHLAKGWADIGYNFAIDGSGRVYYLTGFNVGAHAGGTGEGNRRTVGVVLIVGENEAPSEKMIAAAKAFHLEKVIPRLPRAKRVFGHRDWTSTECPGNRVYANIQAGNFNPTTSPPLPVPEDKRLIKVAGPINHAAATAAINRVGGYAKWLRRRWRLVQIAESIAPDVFLGLECGAGGVWDYIRKKYAAFHFKRAPGGKEGRHWWFDPETWTLKDSGAIDTPLKFRHDDNNVPSPWMIGTIDETDVFMLGFHQDHEASDAKKIGSINHMFDTAEGIAREFGINKSRIIVVGDMGDYDVARTTIRKRGYRSVFPLATKSVNAEYKSNNYWKPTVKGARVDDIFVYVGEGDETDRTLRPVEVANLRLDHVATDHNVPAAVIERQ